MKANWVTTLEIHTADDPYEWGLRDFEGAVKDGRAEIVVRRTGSMASFTGPFVDASASRHSGIPVADCPKCRSSEEKGVLDPTRALLPDELVRMSIDHFGHGADCETCRFLMKSAGGDPEALRKAATAVASPVAVEPVPRRNAHPVCWSGVDCAGCEDCCPGAFKDSPTTPVAPPATASVRVELDEHDIESLLKGPGSHGCTLNREGFTLDLTKAARWRLKTVYQDSVQWRAALGVDQAPNAPRAPPSSRLDLAMKHALDLEQADPVEKAFAKLYFAEKAAAAASNAKAEAEKVVEARARESIAARSARDDAADALHTLLHGDEPAPYDDL